MEIKNTLYKLSGGFTILPLYLAVNITNRCNRSCNFCPFHSKHITGGEHYQWFKGQPDHLPLSHLYRFLNKMGVYRKLITHIAITGKGEPLMNPNFKRFCEICNEFKIPFSVTTNGDMLSIKTLQELCRMKYLTGIRVSAYSVDLVHKWNTISELFKKVTVFNQSGKDVEGIESGYTAVQAEGLDKYCSMPRDFNTIKSCKAPFTHLTINTDGSIVPCYSHNVVGTIYEPFMKLWNGGKIRKYRRDALKMQAEKSGCKNCGIKINLFK